MENYRLAPGLPTVVPMPTQSSGVLRESNDMLQVLFQASPLAIVTLDAAGRVDLWNEAAKAVFGWTRQEVHLLPLPFVPVEQAAFFKTLHSQVLRGSSFTQVQATCQRKSGEHFPVHLSMAPLRNAQGKISSCIAIFADVSEPLRLADELRQTQHRLTESRGAERLHLARELHDGVLQQMMGIRYQLAEARRKQLKQKGREEQVEGMSQMVTELQRETLEVITQVRRVISELRPPGLEELGLKLALEGFLAQLQRQRSSDLPSIQFTCAGADRTLSSPVALCLFRVTQEALRNVLKHACARRISVAVRVLATQVDLTIQDDGRGFQVPGCLGEFTRGNHFGLIGMEERVAALRGTLSIQSQPGEGTFITVRLPVSEP
ncbi:MAG: PAS domain S-box protein [Ardenticatenales bacterium]|nr:PAS domain S-box protein [Ardenticatenales bacterium]